MTGRSRAAVVVLIVLAVTTPAWAQSGDARADADALFTEARALMAEGRYAQACPKLVASQQLDPGIGTLLNLGDCFEKSGRTASAWRSFGEAQEAARKAGDRRRETAARGRASALEARLTRLTILVPPKAQVRGLEIRRDGVTVDAQHWGSAVAVDLGDTSIEASAPGRKRWLSIVHVAEARGDVTVEVPTLERETLTAAAQPANPYTAVDESLRDAPVDTRDADDGSILSEWWLWAAAGGAVAITVVAILATSSGTETRTGKRVTGTHGVVVATLGLGDP